ncbi:MAG: type II toxin-antitoxin system VapC family toxin [Anaerolineales bacterium]
MILYADASMLVKRYLTEAGSDRVAALLVPPTLAGTALITRAEIAAALSKATRVGALTRNQAAQSLHEFRAHWPHLLRLRLSEAVVARADELAWEHGLRGYDAVHLAVALMWQANLDEPLTFATFDYQLWQAAQAQGLSVWPEALP